MSIYSLSGNVDDIFTVDFLSLFESLYSEDRYKASLDLYKLFYDIYNQFKKDIEIGDIKEGHKNAIFAIIDDFDQIYGHWLWREKNIEEHFDECNENLMNNILNKDLADEIISDLLDTAYGRVDIEKSLVQKN